MTATPLSAAPPATGPTAPPAPRTSTPLGPTGQTVYGHPVGALMLDTRFPRPPGDIGNAATWPFPVRYSVVAGAHPALVVGDTDPALLAPFVDAARELVSQGVRVITTSCGFLALFQRELAAAVPVPVVASALLQVPVAAAGAGEGRAVAVLTEREGLLSERHFTGVGWSSRDIDVVVQALAPDAVFPTIYNPAIDAVSIPDADHETLEAELVEAAGRALEQRPDVGAFVMECTNFVPYSAAVRAATGRPVYDLYTAVMQAYHATVGTPFR